MLKYDLIVEARNVPGIGDIGYVEAPFDKAISCLKKGIKSDGSKLVFDDLITLRELAIARIFLGDSHSVSVKGSYVKEGDLYIPEKYSTSGKAKILLLRESLPLQYPASAANAHENNYEWFAKIYGAEINNLQELANSGYDSPVFELKNIGDIPTNSFGENELMVWMFGDKAQDYGLWLKESSYKIENISLVFNSEEYINNKGKSYANQLWLRRLDDNSDVDGDEGVLGSDDGVRGVRREQFAEGREKKTLDTQDQKYSLPEAFNLIQKLFNKEGVIITGDLEKRLRSHL